MRIEWWEFSLDWDHNFAPHDTRPPSEEKEFESTMVKSCLWANYLRELFGEVLEPELVFWNLEQFEAHWITFDKFWDSLKDGQRFPPQPLSIVEKNLEYRKYALGCFLCDALVDAHPEI